ncbi:MAG: pyrroline-5-carboxylate reductase [Gammaproteobacteria bacterium]|nr:pyrroline-5-carboxylate reductase [Gammaproteobacteria bacterium]
MTPTLKPDTTLAFVGGGNMARSIIGGLISSDWPADRILVSDPSGSQRDFLQTQFNVSCFADNCQCVETADIVILAVKPQRLKQALDSIRNPLIARRPLLISIAAGIRSTTIAHWVGGALPIVRVMPNTPALVNCGVSGLMANPLASDQQKRDSEQIMRAVGEVVWVDSDEDIDTVTGISGSGPAYFFKLMESMVQAGIDHGLDGPTARILALQTALGAARLALDSEHGPAELRRQVTSPGGTTEAAIRTMENLNIDAAFSSGINAAIVKSDDLAKTLGEM